MVIAHCVPNFPSRKTQCVKIHHGPKMKQTKSSRDLLIQPDDGGVGLEGGGRCSTRHSVATGECGMSWSTHKVAFDHRIRMGLEDII